MNKFGNLDRFTDDEGLQTYTNPLVIDNLYNLMYTKDQQAADTWNNQIDAGVASSIGGFSDWYVFSTAELEELLDRGVSQGLNYSPFNLTGDFLTSTTRHSNTVRVYTLIATGQNIQTPQKTASEKTLFVRKAT